MPTKVLKKIRSELAPIAPEAHALAKRLTANDVVTACRAHTAHVIQTLVEILDNTNEVGTARVHAARILLEYGYGKPQALIHFAHHYDDQTLLSTAQKILEKRKGHE